MGNYPWGPHGPQSGPNQVTPNPTPAYVPPPPEPAYYPPSSGGGQTSYSGSGYVAPSGNTVGVGYGGHTPGPKRYWLALVLASFFGPLGLFYATKKGALIMLLLLVGVPVSFSVIGVLPYGSMAHPFAILDHDGIMNQMWCFSVVLSMIWSIVGVRRYNAALKQK